jgi:membrane protein involved in colicin uptake
MTKIVALLAVTVALIGALWWYSEHRYAAGVAAGRAAVQVQWDADRQAIEAVADKQNAKNAADLAAALAHNQEVQQTYEANLSAAYAAADNLTLRLRNACARAATGGGVVPTPADRSGSTATGAPSGDAELARLFKLAVVEALDNDDQLDALTEELTPQVKP